MCNLFIIFRKKRRKKWFEEDGWILERKNGLEVEKEVRRLQLRQLRQGGLC